MPQLMLLEYQIKGYFQVQHLSCVALGLDIRTMKNAIQKPLMLLVLFTCAIWMTLGILVFAVENLDDLDTVTDTLSPLYQCLLAIWKLSMFLLKRKSITQLVRQIDYMNMRVNTNERTVLRVENHKDGMFSRAYLLAVLSTGIAALVAPLLIACYGSLSGEPIIWQVPLKGNYFLDATKTASYICIYLLIMLAAYFVVFASVGTDSLFSWLAHNIIAQFRILELRLNAAGLENAGNVSPETLKKCLANHNCLTALVDDLNKIFSATIFVKFAISCLQICIIAYQFSRIHSIMDLIFRGTLLVAITIQILVYCNGGQRIKDESEKVATNIYLAFQWHKLNIKSSKLLQLSIMRSQRHSMLVGFFFVCDMRLLFWVFRTAASYLTILLTLESDDASLVF